ncbi:MAG: hypothetical protein ACQEXJ_16965 [Myxococcota bacterium]
MGDWEAIVEELEQRLAPYGIDLVHPFRIDWYNPHVPVDYRLPEREGGRGLGLLIGNSRAMWRPLLEALRARPTLADTEHPLDLYVSDAIEDTLEQTQALRGLRRCVVWAHEPRVALQRLADLSGLAPLGPPHLNVHPRLGPWFGMHAVVTVDAEGPDGAPPTPRDCCDGCPRPCMEAFEEARRLTGPGVPTRGTLRRQWEAWAAVRQACPVGSEHAYGDHQLRYHYTADPEALRDPHG